MWSCVQIFDFYVLVIMYAGVWLASVKDFGVGRGGARRKKCKEGQIKKNILKRLKF
jgi:hypothetical protein